MLTKSVGQRTPKKDAYEIVTGRAVYANDVQMTGMLCGRILHSPHAHARIRHIDTARARRLPGVVDVVTAEDMPESTLLARDEVCYEGHKVAIVVAEDLDIAEDALSRILVSYDVLPAAIDLASAMAPDAPVAHLQGKTQAYTDAEGHMLSNVVSHKEWHVGHIELGFAMSDVIVEASFEIPTVHQMYLEPNVTTARLEPDGRITIWTSAQGAFQIRNAVAKALNVPHHKIKVIVTKVGGAFGAKNSAFLAPHAALMALRTGRPVKMVMNRDEEFTDGVPAPGCITHLKMGARSDGTFMALEGRVIWDAGWCGGSGPSNRLFGLYHIPQVSVEGLAIRTNKPQPGAYRAPGAPHMAFARESMVDMLAHRLGMDPVVLRLKNARTKGDYGIDGAPITSDWLQQALKKATHVSQWGQKRLKEYQGCGIACGEWTNASGPTQAFLALNEDGSISMVTGQIDLTGLHTVLAQVVAEELGISVGKVTVVLGDTDTVPFTSLSAGSKSAHSAGEAARKAAQEVKKKLIHMAAEILEAPPGDLEFANDTVRVVGTPDQAIALRTLAQKALQTEDGPIQGQWVLGHIPTYPSYSVDVATVEIDPETGRVHLIDLVAVQDVGKALNPLLVEGQIHGGAIQGMGLGLMEGYRYDDEGHLANANLLDYAIPTSRDVPQVQTALVEDPAPHGPYGAKGVGEPPIIPGAAAIANAIYDAIGVRVTQLPMTPERVFDALAEFQKPIQEGVRL